MVPNDLSASHPDASTPQPVTTESSKSLLIQVEAAPPLRSLHHSETINTYQVNLSAKNPLTIKSTFELRRGAVITVNPTAAVNAGGKTYLPITGCDTEPQVVGLYVRQVEVIPLPAGAASLPARAPEKLNVRMIKRANKAGKPVMEISGVKLPPGTVFRVSAVHRVTQADPGTGLIDADGSVDYYLVSECLPVPAAAGFFVQVTDFLFLSEIDYTKEVEKLRSIGGQPQALHVLVTPKNEAVSAFLFQDASKLGKKAAVKVKPGELPIIKSHADTLPAGAELTVDSTATLSGEKEYYRILECPSKPSSAGMYLLTKEVTPIQDVTISSSENSP